MTGFGRASAEEGAFSISVEIKTVNHRFLDFNLRLPRELSHLEGDIREKIKKSLQRGHVSLSMSLLRQGGNEEISLNEEAAGQYLAAFDALAKMAHIKKIKKCSEIIGLSELFKRKEPEYDEESIKKLALSALDEALLQLREMRKKEGENLLQELKARLLGLEEKLSMIEPLALSMPKTTHEKFKQRLNEFELDGVDEARLIQELAIIADRCDIQEEMDRLKSHFKQLNQAFLLENEQGRRMDFLIQELNREVNTISSKASDNRIISLAVDMKCDIEKMREQAQNVE